MALLRRLVRDYKTKVFVELGAEFPTDPQAWQIMGQFGLQKCVAFCKPQVC